MTKFRLWVFRRLFGMNLETALWKAYGVGFIAGLDGAAKLVGRR